MVQSHSSYLRGECVMLYKPNNAHMHNTQTVVRLSMLYGIAKQTIFEYQVGVKSITVYSPTNGLIFQQTFWYVIAPNP